MLFIQNFSGVCSTKEIQWDQGSIDFYPFNFMFPEGSQKVNMLVEGQAEVKLFCIDYVQVKIFLLNFILY